jgi:hypothetical protein
MENKIMKAASFMLIGTVFSFCLALTPHLCQAEFYKYYDPNGVLRFTDDLSEVPVKQRMQVKTYVGYQPEEAKPEASPEKAQDVEASSGKQELALNPAQEEELKLKKTELDKAFQALDKEKKILEDGQKGKKRAASKKQYEKQIKAFNSKVRAYEEKRRAYLKDLAAARSEPLNP